MLYLLAAWVVLGAVAVPTGAAIVRWSGAERVFDRPGDRVILFAWLGLLVLGSGLLAASHLIALSPAAGAVIGCGAAAAALSWRPVREEIALLRAPLDGRLILALLALAAGVALFTAQPVVWFDTGLYHASAIRWLSEFGAVEGVALVHDRLGFGSSWFALAAPLNPEGLREHGAAVMGGLGLFLLCLHALTCVWRALRGAARRADWVLIAGSALLIPGLAVFQKAHVTPSPDLPVNVLGLLVGWAIFTVADAPRGGRSPAPGPSPGPASLPLILALGTMSVKPQAAPLVAVAALFYVLSGEPRSRRMLWAAGLGIVLITPWLAYEFVATGCPAYPLPICTDATWSVGPDAARNLAETVQTFSRWGVEPAPGTGLGWVGPWLTDDLSPSLGGLAVACVLALGGGLLVASTLRASTHRRTASWVGIVGALGLFLVLVRTEEILMVTLACVSLIPLAERRYGTGWLLAIGLTGIGFTLYAAPDPRFAFGYMAVLFARLAVFQGPAIWTRLRPHLAAPARPAKVSLATLLLAAAVAGALGPFVRPTTPSSEGPGVLVPAETADSVTLRPANGIQYRVPELPRGLCWAAELPCTPAYELNPYVGLRDPDRGPGGGFALPAGPE
jgi:hypothetical protein